MSIRENKALIQRVYTLWNRRELEEAFKYFAPDYVEHPTSGDATFKQMKKSTAEFYAAFPDAIATIKDMVAEGDKIAVRVTWEGTHKGEFMGIAPTGKKINITNHAIFRITAGKWAESWATIDGLRFLQQLGVIPK
jgi:steroid delta-isomerase-like uncharacterized protein